MSEHKQYYDAFTARLAHGEGLTPDQCRCNGGGWILSDVDTWHKCPDHYTDQPNPEEEQEAPAVHFKATVIAPVDGEGFHHKWGYSGKAPFVPVGTTVLVTQFTDSRDGSKGYSVTNHYRRMFALTEAKAKQCLKAVRSKNGKLIPLTPAELKQIEDDQRYWEFQMSR